MKQRIVDGMKKAIGRNDSSSAAQMVDRSYYLSAHPDVAKAKQDAVKHFAKRGANENRVPNPWFSEQYVFNYLDDQTLHNEAVAAAYLRSDMSTKPRLIFVCHEATRTGAPAIILRLIEMFSESKAFECFTILNKGGERVQDFEKCSHTYQLSPPGMIWTSPAGYSTTELQQIVAKTSMFARNKPVMAVVNSAESYLIGKYLASIGIPVVSLVHEVASMYTPNVFSDFSHFSEKVIFPSKAIKKIADQYSDMDQSKTMVRGQGLLVDDFGKLRLDNARSKLRSDLGIEDDAFIILNVGSTDIRKGVDLFASVAAKFLKSKTNNIPVYFIWYGGSESKDSALLLAEDIVEKNNISTHVRFMPSTSEVEQIFRGADLFLLSARADPFPCVIHEALASGLPVIAFEEGGGAPELIGDDCGTIVPLGDIVGVCEAIEGYVSDPQRRAKQSRNAIVKIQRDWQYTDYFNDVYEVLQKCGAKISWPTLEPQKTKSHIVFVEGRKRDFDLVSMTFSDQNMADIFVVLIGGRFASEGSECIASLSAAGVPYRVCQPASDDSESRAAIIDQVCFDFRPREVTFVDTRHLIDEDALNLLAFNKHFISGATKR